MSIVDVDMVRGSVQSGTRSGMAASCLVVVGGARRRWSKMTINATSRMMMRRMERTKR